MKKLAAVLYGSVCTIIILMIAGITGAPKASFFDVCIVQGINVIGSFLFMGGQAND